MIQIPRLYDVCKKLGEVACFQVMNRNIIIHVWEVMNMTLAMYITTHACQSARSDDNKYNHEGFFGSYFRSSF